MLSGIIYPKRQSDPKVTVFEFNPLEAGWISEKIEGKANDSDRDDAVTLTPSNSHPAEDIHKDNLADEEDTQPSVAIKRKGLGELTVSKDSVTAGSLNDLTITYKFTEDMEEPSGTDRASVVEIKLPEDWDNGAAPEVFDFDDTLPTAAEVKERSYGVCVCGSIGLSQIHS